MGLGFGGEETIVRLGFVVIFVFVLSLSRIFCLGLGVAIEFTQECAYLQQFFLVFSTTSKRPTKIVKHH